MIHNHKRITFRRSTIIWVLATVLLGYIGLFEHQITHQLGADDVHCAQCLAANHFGHAPLASLPTLPLVTQSEQPLLATAVRFYPVSLYYFSARAPPNISLA